MWEDIKSEYYTWHAMFKRCVDPEAKGYENYGGRGISVCKRWRSFKNFLADMGMRPSAKHTLDRRDNDGNYEPGNCRWATKRQQNLNRRNCLQGRRFGRLVAMKHLGSYSGKWICRCDCGRQVEVQASPLISGGTKSCGCWRRERMHRYNAQRSHA